MDILIVRHGLAGKRDPGAWPDDDLRPLTPRGRRAFAKAARRIRAAGASPRRVLASPAVRALETARILARELGLRRKDVIAVPALHHAVPARSALKALTSLSRDLPAAFAVVGHEPNLGRMLSLLVCGSAGAALPLGKGAACLVEAEAPEPGAGRLLWSLTQDQLAALRG